MYKLFNQCNFYIFLWCLYYLQGTLYASGGMISQAILGLLLIISIYNAYYLNRYYRLPIYFNGLNSLIILLTIYGLYLIVCGDIIYINYRIVPNYFYLKNLLISLLPIYSAYLYTLNKQFTRSIISKWIFVWIIIATIQFYRYEKEALAEMIINQTEITNNSGYLFLAIMPSLVIFNNKPFIQFPLLLYSLAFVFMGMKRGAIIIAIIIFLYFLYRAYKTSSNKINIILFCFISIISTSLFIMNMLETSEYFNHRIEQTLSGNSSNRDAIYSIYWNHILNETNILYFLFGNGANSTLSIGGAYAHNDWLELLINQGIIGVIVYIYYWICFIKTWIISHKHMIAFSSLGMILIISFIKSLFSMSYDSLDIYLTLTLGYFLVFSNKNNFITK